MRSLFGRTKNSVLRLAASPIAPKLPRQLETQESLGKGVDEDCNHLFLDCPFICRSSLVLVGHWRAKDSEVRKLLCTVSHRVASHNSASKAL